LGDVLWIEPVIRQLATRYKKVIVHTKHNELFRNFPLENVVFRQKLNLIEKIIWKLESLFNISFFFINLEMAYEKDPKVHFLNAYQKKARLPVTEEYPKIYLSKEEKEKILIEDKYAVLHIETLSDKNYRRIYGVEWEKIADYLAKKGFKIIQIGKESASIKGTNYIHTSIRNMIVLINKSHFFIGIDSGPSHIAASLGIPSLIFFGAVNPDFRHFRPLFKGAILQQACEFAGCYHESIKKEPVDCRLVGNKGIPKCSLHTTEYVIQKIEFLIKEYKLL
jgi:heptosyltransferase-3